MLYKLIVFLPLIAAMIAGFFGPLIGDRASQVVTCGALIVSCVLSWIGFAAINFGGSPTLTVEVFEFIRSGTLAAAWALRIDQLTCVMLVVVTTVSAVGHVYCVGYMVGERGIWRFMAYLSLFTFAMLMLVTADNLVQLFFGWEGVGLCSYLLIGYWYDRPSACAAAIKAFIVNRIR